jgi:hypothetical protein
MTQKKTDLMPAGQTNLFNLLKGEGATTVQTETPSPVSLNPVFSIQPAGPTLPDGWIETDIRFLLKVLEDGPILVADTHLGIQIGRAHV